MKTVQNSEPLLLSFFLEQESVSAETALCPELNGAITMKWWTATVGAFAVLATVTITAALARPGRGSGFVVDSRHHEHHWKHNLARKEAKCGYEVSKGMFYFSVLSVTV